MRHMKADHEHRFLRLDSATLKTLTDWTELDTLTEVRNLERCWI